ncbi:protein SRC2-like [Cynara cardunculus var. scolymus]|uniref:protein SRC2-like n=1 Tax=Cynara cardunculus var. scolymus TaxID=59895 RepID=UPI000D63045E|nr:protein SRC2-like [Cynara cardunculus var. scolymus]
MEYRTLDLTLISAKGLKNATLAGKMDVYAVASISGSFQKLRTPVNKGAGPNPTWNFPMKFTVDEAAAMHNCLTLIVKIKAVGMFVNREQGEVHVSIKELMEGVKSDGRAMQFVSYQVRRPSGKPKGEISFSYKFGEKFSGKAEEPVMAYPPGRAVGSSSGYPPPYATEYPSRPQAGYAYASYPPPPPPPVYGGYPPQQPPINNRSGMGVGTGLLGGALGGMLLGSMLSDAGGCGGGCGGGGCGGGCGGGGCGGS